MQKKNWKLLILLLILSFIMVGNSLLLHVAVVNDHLVIYATLSLILVCPISIYYLLIRPRNLPKLSIYISFVLCLAAAYFIIPASERGFLNKLLIWLIPLVELSLIIIIVYSIVTSIMYFKKVNPNKQYNFLEVMKLSLEPKFGNGFTLAAILTELGVFYYGFVVLFKKPRIKEQEIFTYHKTSQIKVIAIVFSLLIVVESVGLHIVIQMWSDIAAWIFTILNIYALLYIIGLYNSTKYLAHTINDRILTIHFGYQSQIEIDICQIENIQTATQVDLGTKVPKETYYSLLIMDSPQYELLLKEPILMMSAYGKKKYVKNVVFRCDEPTLLISRLHSLIKSSRDV